MADFAQMIVAHLHLRRHIYPTHSVRSRMYISTVSASVSITWRVVHPRCLSIRPEQFMWCTMCPSVLLHPSDVFFYWRKNFAQSIRVATKLIVFHFSPTEQRWIDSSGKIFAQSPNMVGAVGFVQDATNHTVAVLSCVEVVVRFDEGKGLVPITSEERHKVRIPLKNLRRQSLVNPIRDQRRTLRRSLQV